VFHRKERIKGLFRAFLTLVETNLFDTYILTATTAIRGLNFAKLRRSKLWVFFGPVDKEVLHSEE
jgi:hypothetical protein